ncbi:UrcA family protein [Sphingomonas sp. YR710]|uniref:UrcA family protein n=1 Tax=Sphingomonas sp. YR710 TaxID=1882773 RepID=UPI000881676D|nr:UrcA family protein [Sphingomonas sp. YR710]SDC22406.1 UrcA family protein [Sphingomonas sp. YR710]
MTVPPTAFLPHARKAGSLVAIVLAATLSAAAIAAHDDLISVSASPVDSNSKIANVKIADLDLRSAVGRKSLHARLAMAVREVCTFGGDRGPRLPADSGCTGDAAASAEKQARSVIAMATNGNQSASTMPATVALHGVK